MTIETIIARILRNQPNHPGTPVRQLAIDAITELLQESAPLGHDTQATIHDLADHQLDKIVAAANQALGVPMPQPPPTFEQQLAAHIGVIVTAVLAALEKKGN